ncbi:hypothetical protein ABI052_14880, partial [Enterococcus faecium]|uniref:hypothetical protein n=1 Tax=Enterococcus faecium TaxID=1352 RepID=UPI003F42C1CF
MTDARPVGGVDRPVSSAQRAVMMPLRLPLAGGERFALRRIPTECGMVPHALDTRASAMRGDIRIVFRPDRQIGSIMKQIVG